MSKFLFATGALSLFMTAAAPAFAQAGQLDPSFGSGGVVASAPLTLFTGAALAPNGDIVMAGGAASTATFLRYLPNGSPDPSFGTGGVVSLPAPASFFLGESFPLAMAVQSDGKILATFYAFNNTSTESEALLIRLDTNGELDATFGSGGQVPLNFPTPANFGASATRVVEQPDGKILVTGNLTPPFRSKSAPLTLLARYLANGELDSSFGTNGVSEVVTPVDLPVSLALLSGDGILALNNEGSIAVAQFSSSGALVTPATGGTLVEAANLGDPIFAPNGEYLLGQSVAGTEGKTNVDAAVRKFEISGTADTSFQSPTIRFAPDAPGTKTLLTALAVDAKGRVIVGGELESANFGSGVARLNANGSLDTSFGSNGIGAIVRGFTIFAVLVQPDNRVIMFSGTGNLARYLAQ